MKIKARFERITEEEGAEVILSKISELIWDKVKACGDETVIFDLKIENITKEESYELVDGSIAYDDVEIIKEE